MSDDTTVVPPAPAKPWAPHTFDGTDPLRDAVMEAVGSASVCWSNPGGAGTFDSALAIWVADGLTAWINEHIAQRERLVHQLAEALRLTREYVDPAAAVTDECLLPPIEGWSWYDAMVAYGEQYPEVNRWWETSVEMEAILLGRHRADIDTDIDSGEFIAGCSCGWTSKPVESHTLAEQAFTQHFGERFNG